MRDKLTLESTFIEGIEKLCSSRNIISISGKSGTGKTTLALNLVDHLIGEEDSCIWVQASELFPKRRLYQMLENYPERLEYVNESIYVIPGDSVIHSYKDQAQIMEKIVSPTADLPPNLSVIVIDNISHHLRFVIGQNNNISEISRVMDEFYGTQIWPLLLFCKRNNIILILIHEVTFVPGIAMTRPFFYKLYDRIKTIDIVLSDMINSTKKTLSILVASHEWKFTYNLDQTGIAIS